MPDITMCNGHECPLKEKCYRYTAPPTPYWQAYFCDSPYKTETKNCEHFWLNKNFIENVKEKKMKIFIIQPVRNISEEYKNEIEKYVKKLENEGHNIYLPMRDTDQNDLIGYKICCDNRKAIMNSHEIHIVWDSNSQGVLFDLGMAFAMRKKIKIINDMVPELTLGEKSFPNMIAEWGKRSKN